jgi:hypothetical protein
MHDHLYHSAPPYKIPYSRMAAARASL